MSATTRTGARSQLHTPSKAQSTTTRSETGTETETARIITSSARRTARPSPYLLLLYPVILATGSLYAVISPIAHLDPTSSSSSSGTTLTNLNINTTAHTAQPNYFASKRNLLNLLFVKQGWLWTSLAFLFLQLTTTTTSTTTSSRNNQKLNYRLQALLRYAVVTTSWLFMTKWFFGPSLIDRSFTLTGGQCEYRPHSSSPSEHLALNASATACKAAGGRWRGGHDLSGHVFMLVLSSAFLLYELYLADSQTSQSPSSDSATPLHTILTNTSTTQEETLKPKERQLKSYARYFLYAVVALDGLMLLTTAIWFHTWLEKLSGMVVAGTVVYGTYFAGRGVEV